MNKKDKKKLNSWLKAKSKLAKSWLMLAIAMASIAGLLLIAQAGLLAHILHQLIILHTPKTALIPAFIALALVISGRALTSYAKEQAGFRAGQAVRQQIRASILAKLEQLGPASIQTKAAGSWASLIFEQVEEMQDFYARYLPQLAIAVFIPLLILLVVFPLNWAVGLIFLLTAPLVPFFMALVGMGAADANRRNFKALQRLSGHFYDRLRGLATLRLFAQLDNETQYLEQASDDFRKRTMEVLRLAFLSSAVLEFFTAVSIAITAVYFGFSYIGELDFGHYGIEISLFTGLFVLILAPEFYQPLRDLGAFYHAKAQAIGAAESIVAFLAQEPQSALTSPALAPHVPYEATTICASQLEVLSPEGEVLVGPIDFEILPLQKVAFVGASGAGKTSIINAILGFLPYRGSLKINGIELNQANITSWRKQISWVGQNPQLFHGSIRDNIHMNQEIADENDVAYAAAQAYVTEFSDNFADKLDYQIGDRASGLSVGQAQRIAVARALLQNGQFWLLDEPTASLDKHSEALVMQSLKRATHNKTLLLITHRLEQLADCDNIWVIDAGKCTHCGSLHALQQQGIFSDLSLGSITTKPQQRSNTDA